MNHIERLQLISRMEHDLATLKAGLALQVPLTLEGWLQVTPANIPPVPSANDPARQGCAWNETEVRDLVQAHLDGADIEVLAHAHRRSERAINSQLSALLRLAAGPLTAAQFAREVAARWKETKAALHPCHL